METVFVNVEKCIGCRHCELACARVHARDKKPFSGLTDLPKPRIKVGTGVDFIPFPNRCRHCDPAPCLQICPSGAIYKDEGTGAVLINENRCISCAMCAMVCPFNAISFYPASGMDHEVAYKCDNCIDCQKKDKIPACVDACKTNALVFGEINGILDEKEQGFIRKFTEDLNGGPLSDLPDNIRAFKAIKQKIAQLGPMPSSN